MPPCAMHAWILWIRQLDFDVVSFDLLGHCIGRAIESLGGGGWMVGEVTSRMESAHVQPGAWAGGGDCGGGANLQMLVFEFHYMSAQVFRTFRKALHDTRFIQPFHQNIADSFAANEIAWRKRPDHCMLGQPLVAMEAAFGIVRCNLEKDVKWTIEVEDYTGYIWVYLTLIYMYTSASIWLIDVLHCSGSLGLYMNSQTCEYVHSHTCYTDTQHTSRLRLMNRCFA